ncbi:hypothetical protein F5Y09DRAFT_312339 [Xylaria sp. FL1042]|nr:hypothetical protein F5Y09DRAFT_312339 [Xylaria sp. FL1042]
MYRITKPSKMPAQKTFTKNQATDHYVVVPGTGAFTSRCIAHARAMKRPVHMGRDLAGRVVEIRVPQSIVDLVFFEELKAKEKSRKNNNSRYGDDYSEDEYDDYYNDGRYNNDGGGYNNDCADYSKQEKESECEQLRQRMLAWTCADNADADAHKDMLMIDALDWEYQIGLTLGKSKSEQTHREDEEMPDVDDVEYDAMDVSPG